MSSSRDNRQRAAARARLERQMAARREAARRRRMMQTRIAGLAAGVVLVGAVVWIVTAVLSSDGAQPAGAKQCYKVLWPTATPGVPPTDTASPDPSVSVDPSATPSVAPSPTPPEGMFDVGVPSQDPPRSGYQIVTFDTNLGIVEVEMDLSKAPCTAASIAHLVSKGYYDHKDPTVPSCHRLVPEIFALQCGDPTGTGFGGPTYTVIDENLQTGKLPAYHTGDVAMAKTDQPDTAGSQFFFVFGTSQLPGDYTLFGRVVRGLDIIERVGEAGYDPALQLPSGGGPPRLEFTFNKVTVGPITAEPTPVPSPSPSPTPSPTPSPSATPSPTAS